MKIKLAILESDKNYLDRIVAAFTSRFSEKLELYSFTEVESALRTINDKKIDVLIADDIFEIDMDKIPKRCGFAYFVDSVEIETYRNQRTICKFQKAELIYKEILSIYSETVSAVFGIKLDNASDTSVLTFVSASGGAGSSTLAAACAVTLAKRGHSVLYLNLEQFGSSNLFFEGEGQFDFGDIIYAIKSKKSNLSLKLESTVKQDVSGVHFYDTCKSAMDLTEMSQEDYQRLMDELIITGYEYVIVDMDFYLNKTCFEILKRTQNIVFVSDGSEIANKKFERAYSALYVLDQQMDSVICNRIGIIYNKFSNKTGRQIENDSIGFIGGIPKFEQGAPRQIVEQISEMAVFDKLF